MYKYISSLVQKIKSSEKGQGMVEYALIIAFVASIAIFAFGNGWGENIQASFTNAAQGVEDANGAAQEAGGGQ